MRRYQRGVERRVWGGRNHRHAAGRATGGAGTGRQDGARRQRARRVGASGWPGAAWLRAGVRPGQSQRQAARAASGGNYLCPQRVAPHDYDDRCPAHLQKADAADLDGGGDYLFVVKGNQRMLYDDISAAFTVLPPHGSWEQAYWQYEAVTIDYSGHGRTEQITLESTTALNHYLAFPGIAQVVRRTRCATLSLPLLRIEGWTTLPAGFRTARVAATYVATVRHPCNLIVP